MPKVYLVTYFNIFLDFSDTLSNGNKYANPAAKKTTNKLLLLDYPNPGAVGINLYRDRISDIMPKVIRHNFLFVFNRLNKL